MYSDAANGATTIGSYLEAERLAWRAAGLLHDRTDPHPALPDSARGVEQARAQSLDMCRRAREAGALAALGGALQVAADTTFRLGDRDTADAAALEAIQVAGEVGQPAIVGWVLTIRARILAARGRPEESRAAARAALQIAETARIRAGLRYVHAALGFLEPGLDRIGAAIGELETVGRLTEGAGVEDPVIVPWEPDPVEAYVRQGRAGDARRVLARLELRANRIASPVARAAAARCRGMVDDDFELAFTAALALDDQRPIPFERARTLLAFGRRLHRARRRAEARDRLLAARDGFEQLGAAARAGQAEAELHAAGARRRREPDDSALTQQELRVAAAAQRGAPNRDIAADLFLSPKTVEFHLRQIYRKLGVHSRTQLSRRSPSGPHPRRPQGRQELGVAPDHAAAAPRARWCPVDRWADARLEGAAGVSWGGWAFPAERAGSLLAYHAAHQHRGTHGHHHGWPRGAGWS